MNIDELKLDPAAHFDKPSEIVEAANLTMSQKRELLKQWKIDAELLQEAAGEGMDGGEDGRLHEVTLALNALEAMR